MKLQIIEKAYEWNTHEPLDGFYNPDDHIVFGETAGKAKYQLFKEMQDLGWVDSFDEIIQNYSIRRCKYNDKVKLPDAPILETLSQEQKQIVFHTNGNNDSIIGDRNHYFIKSENKDISALIEMGLMKKGNAIFDGQYYHLTEIGQQVANSVLTMKRIDVEYLSYKEPQKTESTLISLQTVKRCPEFLESNKDRECRIYSGQWGYYWRSNGSGYGGKSEAGIYTFKDAYDRTSHCGKEKGIYFEFIEGGES
ncbi:hypothetical protein [Marinicellulosiphila megalodicopiae]|uniref:hypothetical protein n=1 Tax=Marinicellulosiphila megalodicopiae TaxID=2724896 RepID=UPI003BB04B3D